VFFWKCNAARYFWMVRSTLGLCVKSKKDFLIPIMIPKRFLSRLLGLVTLHLPDNALSWNVCGVCAQQGGVGGTRRATQK
jgi:hypothetical protein